VRAVTRTRSMRYALQLWLLYNVYRTAGWPVTGAVLYLFVANEAQGLVLVQTMKIVDRLRRAVLMLTGGGE